MRRLVWFVVGFTAATTLFVYFISGTFALSLSVCVILAAFLVLRTRNPKRAVIGTVLLGMFFGLIYNYGYDQVYLNPIRKYDGRTLDAQIVATDYSFATDYGGAVDGEILLDGTEYDVRLYFYTSEYISPGDIISGGVQLRYTPPGGKDPTTYHKGEGIFLLAYADGELQHLSAAEISFSYFPAYLRRNITQRIDQLFSDETAFFAKALLLGDDGDMGFADNVAFQKSGMRHIVAVSGLHVSILFSVLYFLTGRKRLLSLLVGIPVLIVFAAVAGFTPSVVRACIMQGLVLVATAVDREYDPATALSFSVVAILVINPLAMTSVSFQLSVGCMIGIFAFSHPIRRYLLDTKRLGKFNDKSFRGRFVRWFAGSVSVSVSAMIVTLPFCALYFDMVSLIGVVANLLTLPIVSFAFCGIAAACVLSFVWMPLGSIAAASISIAIEYVLLVARGLSRLPFAVAYTDSIYTVAWLVISYILIFLFVVFKQKAILSITATVVALYGLSLLATWAEPRFDDVRVSAIDVGQGQCVLIQSNDRAYMIDCGGGNAENAATAAMNWLGSQGIGELDGLILTHYDADHANGALMLMQVMDIEMLYLPDVEPKNEIRQFFLEQADAVTWIDSIYQIPCELGNVTIIPAESGQSGNESSMCILFQGENCDILITGDRDIAGEQALLSQYPIGDIDVLIAGHHGAATSTGAELLYYTDPEIVLISVGYENRHGHPDEDVLRRLENAGCIVYRTDLEGTILIRG